LCFLIRKASGQRFYIGNCLISVGTVEHAGSALKPCIEISYCPTEEDQESDKSSIDIKVESSNDQNINDKKNLKTKEELYAIAYQLHNVVIDLLAAHTAAHTLPIPIQTKIQSGIFGLIYIYIHIYIYIYIYMCIVYIYILICIYVHHGLLVCVKKKYK
jgi:hypothetical protein